MNKDTKLASGLLRILSGLVEIMVWTLFFLLVLLVTSTSVNLYGLLNSLLYGLIIVIAVTAFGAPLINSYLTSHFGGGFGKLMTGTRIVNEESGLYLDFKSAFLRNHIGYAVSGVLMGLGFIWIFVDDKKQAWHDMLVSSLVIVKSRQAYLLALLSILLLIVVNMVVVNKAYSNVNRNRQLYTDIYEDIRGEIESINEKQLFTPEGDYQPEEIGLLH